MIRLKPNNSFDSSTRHIDVKVQVYFDTEPTTFYSSDFLVDVSVIEESSGEAKNPLGAVSANELDFSLANLNDIFTPSNDTSPYYGKIKVGLLVEAFMCSTMSNLNITADNDTSDIVWISLGKYTVTNWTAKAGSLLATVSATDVMQSILSMPMPRLNTLEKVTYEDTLKYLFEKLQVADYAILDGLDSTILDYVPFYSNDTVPSVLQKISEAAICAIFADRTGKLVVKPFSNASPSFDLTDDNQIISIDTQQSVLKSYNGVDVSFYRHQLSVVSELLNVRNLAVPIGSFTHGPYIFEKPLYKISSVISEADGAYFVPMNTYDACSSDILLITSYGEGSVIESGMYDVMTGTKKDSDEYNRSSSSFTCSEGSSYRIYTELIGGGDNLYICLLSDNDELIQTLPVPISEDGICYVTIPQAYLNKKIVVELGALSYLDGSNNDEATNRCRFPIYVPVIPGSTYKVNTLNKSMAGEAFNAFFYDDAKAFVKHQTITIDRKGVGSIEVPSGVSYLKCHFSTSIVPVETALPIEGRTNIKQRRFTFYASTNTLKIGDTVTITTESDTSDSTTTISVQGISIESTKLNIKDQASSVLKVDNSLLQSARQAAAYKEKLTKFVNAVIPELTLVIRGNPLMELGDVISVNSAKYKISFTGVLKRAEYNFTGSLSCKITLLNTEVIA